MTSEPSTNDGIETSSTVAPSKLDANLIWTGSDDGYVFVTRDGGASWERQDKGFPRDQGWFTVKRQAFCGDGAKPMGLYLGTNSGSVFASPDEGENWHEIARHLPPILSIEALDRR